MQFGHERTGLGLLAAVANAKGAALCEVPLLVKVPPHLHERLFVLLVHVLLGAGADLGENRTNDLQLVFAAVIGSCRVLKQLRLSVAGCGRDAGARSPRMWARVAHRASEAKHPPHPECRGKRRRGKRLRPAETGRCVGSSGLTGHGGCSIRRASTTEPLDDSPAAAEPSPAAQAVAGRAHGGVIRGDADLEPVRRSEA